MKFESNKEYMGNLFLHQSIESSALRNTFYSKNEFIYIYIYIFLLKWRFPAENSTSFLHFSRNTDIEDPDGCLDTALKFLTALAKFVYGKLSLSLC